MSEPVAKPRYFGEPSNAFDVDAIERRMRESLDPGQAARDADPLAELARLVGQTNNDAFSRIFDVQDGPTAPPPARSAAPRLAEPPMIPSPARDARYAAPFDARPEPRRDDSYLYAEPGFGEEHAPQGQSHQGHATGQGEADYGYSQQGHEQDGYAQQDAGWQGQGYSQGNYYQDYDEPPRRKGRAKLLISAAVLVVVGGAAGAYLLRGAPRVGKDAPTIMANSGPTKVQPAEPASDGPKPSISLLERGAPGSSQSRLVQNEEQPVDVGATARAGGSRPARAPDAGNAVTLAPPPPPPVANSIFAEPKRVKTVAVRPDGTIIDSSPQPAAPRAEAPVPAPATPLPSMANRPMDIAALVASTTPASGPKTATRPVEPPKPPVKPAAVASAPATTASIPAAAAGAGSGFSVQLAGTTSIEEARDAVERLTRRFTAELGPYRPSVVKADVGSKTVYRVRVKSLSSDDANTLCAKLKSGGGSCFVARD